MCDGGAAFDRESGKASVEVELRFEGHEGGSPVAI